MKYHNISIKEGMWNEKQISKKIWKELMLRKNEKKTKTRRNCKGLKARHEEVQHLINKTTLLYMSKEAMIDNSKYNLGRKYKLYATLHQVREAKVGQEKK